MMTTTTVATPDPDDPAGGQVVALPARTAHIAPGPDTASAAQVTHTADPGTEMEPAPEVVDGELLSPAEEAELDARRRHGAAQLAVRHAGQMVRVVRAGVTHPRTRAAGTFVVRHGTYLVKGAEAARRRRQAERGHTDARAARAQALESGDLERVVILNKQLQDARHTRVDVVIKWVEVGWSAARKLGYTVVIVTGTALVTGILNGWGQWLGEWNVLDVLHTLRAIITSTATTVAWSVRHWWVFGLAGVGVWGARRWCEGHRLGETVLPQRLRTLGRATQYVELTESALAAALANIGNPKLNQVIKAGWPNRDTDTAWVQPPMLDPGAKGWSVKIRLPLGVPVAAINRAKESMAHNLGCRPQELFIEPDEHDSTVLDLFRLDPGVLREPVPDYPLLEQGTTDYWTGFPVGISPRGEQVIGATFERNHVYSGAMGSGKTSMVIALLTGAILDPLVDIDVFVFAENADYDVLKPCLNTVSLGDTAENVTACLEHMRGLHTDLAVRGELLQKYGETSATRELAAKEPRLRPRIVVIDECQSFFRQDKPEDRRTVVNMMVRFFSAARKYGVTCMFVTPVPSDQSLPRDLVSVTTNRACGAIGDKTRNNVVLGDKAHENGISALGLRPAVKKGGKLVALNDVGTLVTVGFMDRPGPVRSYNVTRDQQATVVQRAVRLRGGPTTPVQRPTVVDRDWLTDLAEVCLGQGERIKLTDAARWMRKHAPGYLPYRALDGKTLADWLDRAGVPVSWPSRQPTVVTERVIDTVRARCQPGVSDPPQLA